MRALGLSPNWAPALVGVLISYVLLFGNIAAAQSIPLASFPPTIYTQDQAGVDQKTGAFTYKIVDLAGSGLQLERQFNSKYSAGPFGPGTSHNFSYTVVMGQDSSGTNVILITRGLETEVFKAVSGKSDQYISQSGNGSTLTTTLGGQAASAYTLKSYPWYNGVLTAADGTKSYFIGISASTYADNWHPSLPCQTGQCGILDKVTYPSGEVITFQYTTISSGYSPTNRWSRLASVTSNRGSQLTFSYLCDNASLCSLQESSGQTVSQNLVLKVTLLNLGDWGKRYSPALPYPVQGELGNEVMYSYGPVNSPALYVSRLTGTHYDSNGYNQSDYSLVTKYTMSPNLLSIKQAADSMPTVVAFDNQSRVTTITDGGGKATLYDYSTAYQTTATDPNGSKTVTYFDNDAQLRPLRVLDTTGQTTFYGYDAFFRLTGITMPEGNRAVYEYDSRGNLNKTTLFAKSGSLLTSIISGATYADDSVCTTDPIRCNRPVKVMDALGNETSFKYDPAHGGVTTITYPSVAYDGGTNATPLATISYQQYSVSGQVGNIWAPSSRTDQISSSATTVAKYGYDELCTGCTAVWNNISPTTLTVDLNGTTLKTLTRFDFFGAPIEVDGARSDGDIRKYVFNARRQAILVTDPSVSVWSGSASVVVSPMTRFTYDDNGRQTKIERSLNGGWRTTGQTDYDLARGYVTSVTGADGLKTAFSVDNAGRPYESWQTADGTERRARTGLDALGRVTSVRVGVGTALEQVRSGLTYTRNGLKASETDASGNVLTYCYDGFDRLNEIRFPAPGQAAGGNTPTCDPNLPGYIAAGGQLPANVTREQYGYDAASNVTSIVKRDGQVIVLTYDALNRLIRKDAPGRTIAYGYDLLGRRLSAKVTQDASLNQAWAYDGAGRVTAHTGVGGRRVSFAYDPGSTWYEATVDGGRTIRYTSDALGRVTKIEDRTGGVTLASYLYDELSRRVKISLGNNTSTTYAYDDQTRLMTLKHDLAGAANDVTFTIGYTGYGEIKTRDRDNDAYAWLNNYNISRDYRAGSDDSTALGGNALNQYGKAGGNFVQYDARGNLQRDSAQYGYSAENELLSSTGSLGASFAYGAAGRVGRVTSQGVSTEFLYDGNDLVGEYSGGALARQQVHGPGVDEPIATFEGGAWTYLYADERGSVVALADVGGNRSWINSYGPYGEPGLGPPGQQLGQKGRFGFTGQAYFPEVKLYDFKARTYSPYHGRFLQADPIGTAGGMNLYEYAGGDPVNDSDPDGLAPPGVEIVVTAPRLLGFPDPGTQASNRIINGAINGVGRLTSGVVNYFNSKPTGSIGDFAAGACNGATFGLCGYGLDYFGVDYDPNSLAYLGGDVVGTGASAVAGGYIVRGGLTLLRAAYTLDRAGSTIAEVDALLPPGVTRASFGKIVGFSSLRTLQGASVKATAGTIAELRSLRVSRQLIAIFQNFYVREATLGNVVAAQRAKLLFNILRKY